MKEMIYKPTREVTILADDTYKGYHYVIISYGVHPCAYVEIPKDHKYYDKDYRELDITVHGGLTYGSSLADINIGSKSDYYIGWDYAHAGDFVGYYFLINAINAVIQEEEKKYTTKEIFEDVKKVIEQLD